MRKDVIGKIGLAAVVLLAPGGFILGATLAGNHYRKRLAERRRADGERGEREVDGERG